MLARTFFIGRFRINACGLRDRLRDAALAEPEIRADRAGRHVIDADAARAKLLRKRLREIDKGDVGGAIVNRAGIRLEKHVHRSDVHDRAATVLDHKGHGRARRS